MFIAHGELVRKYSKWILAAVLLILVPGFIALFTTTDAARGTKEDLPTIRGKAINPAAFQRAEDAIRIQYRIGMGRDLPWTRDTQDQIKQEATIQWLLLRKAAEHNIRVSDEDLVQFLRSQQMFRNEQGQFDPNRYNRFRVMLSQAGVSEGQYEEMLRNQLAIGRLRALVTAGAKVTPRDIHASYAPMHEKLQVDVVKISVADHKDPVEISDKDAQDFYEQNKNSFRRPAEVKVRYVLVTFADGRKAITVTDQDISEYYERSKHKYAEPGKEPRPLDAMKDEIREELLIQRADRWAGDRATELTVKLVFEPGTQRPDFAKVAAEFGVTPQETDFFSKADEVKGVDAGPQFGAVAFTLTNDSPFSDPVQGKTGYYVLEYVGGKPSVIPPFEQVKDKAIEQLKKVRIYDATLKRGEELVKKVKELTAKGKSFADACKQLGLKPESPAPFSVADEKPEFEAAAQVGPVTMSMAPNAVSELIPTTDGGMFFHLRSRTPAGPQDFEKAKDKVSRQVLDRNRQQLWQDWLDSLIRQEQVDFKLPPRPQLPPELEEEPSATS